ncbi:MAG: glycosyltransferase family 39 protein [Chloroflexi bacterium]|nr:glycosyltransferase family 39 protein [Chloroflexota bacterium]
MTTLRLAESLSSVRPEQRIRDRRRSCDRAIWAVIIAFVLLGALYSVTTPAFEALDELWHYPYVKHLADGKGLPILGKSFWENRYNQEGGQPPLYYAIGALATFWIDTGTQQDVYQINPHAAAGQPLRSDNKNMVIHTPEEGFPYRGVYLALHIIRILSVLMGAATVYLTYVIGAELFPGEPYVALGAAAFNAFLPEFLFLSGSVNNDNLVTLLGSSAILLILRAAKGRISSRGIALLSLLVGLASVTKLSGLALVALVTFVAFSNGIRKRSMMPFVRLALPVWISTVVLAGWWHLRNWQLYGDPTGLNAFLKVVGERSPKPSFVEILANEGEGLRLSFWGVFGGFNVLAAPMAYRLFDSLSILALLGLIAYVVFQQVRRRFDTAYYPLAFALCWVIVLAISLLRWTQLTLASQGRLLFPALSVISCIFALGICSLAPRRMSRYLVGGIAGVTILASGLVPFVSILPAYPGPARLSDEDLARFQHPLGINFEGKVKLLGMDLSSPRVAPGQALSVSLYLSSLADMNQDYSTFIHVFAGNGELIGQIDSYPGRGSLPTSRWKPGLAIKDTYSIPITRDHLNADVLRIESGFYNLRDMVPLRAFDLNGNPIGTSPIIGRVKLVGEDAIRPLAQDYLAVLGGKVGLVDYAVESRTAPADSTLRGSLTWQALGKLDRDYSVFVQLVGHDGLMAQYDSYPRKGTYPTSFWDEGEVVHDWFELQIGREVPEGDYDLILGMYDLATGDRLSVGGNTFVRLQGIHVTKN